MTNVKWSFGSIIALAAAGASLLLPVLAKAQGDPELAGVPPAFFLIGAALLAATVVGGRMRQAARGIQRPVTWGWASTIGYASALLTAIAPFIGDLAGSLAPLQVPSIVWTSISYVILIVTTLGRMDQASAGGAAAPHLG